MNELKNINAVPTILLNLKNTKNVSEIRSKILQINKTVYVPAPILHSAHISVPALHLHLKLCPALCEKCLKDNSKTAIQK